MKVGGTGLTFNIHKTWSNHTNEDQHENAAEYNIANLPSAVDTVDGINLLEPQTSEAMLAKQSLKVNRVALMSLKGKKRRDSITSSIDRKNRKQLIISSALDEDTEGYTMPSMPKTN